MGRSPDVPLSSLTLRITKGTTPTTHGRPFVTEGINFVKSEAICDGRIDSSKFAFIDADTHNLLARSQLREDDVLFSMAGFYLGKTAVVPQDILPANTNQAVGIIRIDRTKADPRFIHYVLSSKETQSWVQRSVAQSAQPNFNLAEIGRLPIPCLPLEDQRAIAGVLGVIDAKIELNRRMQVTLEEMAQALFKSWFVDFDPVGARVEGRDTRLAPEISTLFSTSFVESDVGEIPKGWSVVEVMELANASRVGINPGESPSEVFAHYSIPAFDANRLPALELGEAIRSNKFLVSPKSVLLSRLNPRTPRVWMPQSEHAFRGVCSTEFAVMVPFATTREWLYCMLSSPEFGARFAMMVTGTSGSHQRVKPESLATMRVVAPPGAIVERFTEIVVPLLARAGRCLIESVTLASLRDTLLPKLISGEILIRHSGVAERTA